MREVLDSGAMNPSSAHHEGRVARRILREARAEVASALGAHPDEVVFTSGVTESLALAVHGLSLPGLQRKACSAYEHAAVYEALAGDRFTFDAIPTADLLACALVNHETGLLAPLSDICVKAPTVIVDAAQATSLAPAAWRESSVKAMALSSYKIGGPTGAGALLVRKGQPFLPLVRGGPQEHELRAGTEAVAAAAGFARALSEHLATATSRQARLAELTAAFERGLSSLRAVRIVAADRPRAPGVTAAYAIGVPARAVVEDLDARGIAIGAGAACAAHSNEPSNVLRALGLSRERATEVFRVSFCGTERDADVETALGHLKEVIDKRRGEVAVSGP